MKKLITIPLLFICFLLSGQDVFYVSPTGDDAAAGGIATPWKTWGKAFTSAAVDDTDTVYFRGGIYYKSLSEPSGYFRPDGTGYAVTRDGSVGAYIHYYAYPGETPILDDSNIISPTSAHYGIRGTAVNYVKFKGLTIRNVWQKDGSSTADGFSIDGNNIVIENCTVYNIHGGGFVSGTAVGLYYINCDAYNCCDSLTTAAPGNDGTGFRNITNTVTSAAYFIHCRAWLCGDQGFSSTSSGYAEYDGCWSFHNGMLSGSGNGYKMGWIATVTAGKLHKLYKNCLAAYNRQFGFWTNDAGKVPGWMQVYNSIAYYNGYFGGSYSSYGYRIENSAGTDAQELLRIFRNNVSYANEDGTYSKHSLAQWTNEYNSWNTPPGVTLSDADFTSVDSTGLTGARDADGHLPDLSGFLHLAVGSDLIGAGMGVGLYYDGDSAVWAEPPSLGAYEYNSPPPPPPPIPPVVTTTEITDYSATMAVIGGTVTDTAGTVASRGIVWSTTVNPTTTTADSIAFTPADAGTFSIRLTTLKSGTTYYFRAFGRNETDIQYGDTEVITTPVHSQAKHNGSVLKLNHKTVIHQ